MITAGKTYKAAVAKSDIYTYLMCIPASGYFIVVAGGYSSERMKAFFIAVLGYAAIMFVADTITIQGWFRNLIKNYENSAYKRDMLKTDILNLPYKLARKSMIKWLMSIIFVPLAIYITVGYSLLNFMPLLIIIPLMALVNFNIMYFNAENSMEELLSEPGIRDAEPVWMSYKELSLVKRILIFSVTVMMIPIIIFGYLLYLSNSDIIKLEHIGFHLSFICILNFIVVFVCIYLIAINLNKSSKNLKKALESIKNGDFTIRGIPMLGSSELGAVSQYANSLLLKLKDVIINVKESSGLIYTSSDNIKGASQGLSQSAAEQASGVEEISSTIEEMLSSVVQNSDNATEANRLVENSYKLAENGTKIVSETVDSINRINASSRKIEEIISVINDIAFQTNLLALNAAIEAARAGEHGRGFAVVATEVRNLAQRSRTSSDEIGKLIRNSVENVAEGTRLANESGQALHEIFSGIEQVRRIVSEIYTASVEQKSGLNQITQAVGEADMATQKNAAASEELASTAETLSENSAEMNNMMKYFKVQ
ncbi:MAG TPA: methyl-accepting chemotaxis protein [Spirochaetota bacterium]|nr:methyl-accepting chemotaxis protein [Spirochaetota bacterium]